MIKTPLALANKPPKGVVLYLPVGRRMDLKIINAYFSDAVCKTLSATMAKHGTGAFAFGQKDSLALNCSALS
jgi:hypothetical protein